MVSNIVAELLAFLAVMRVETQAATTMVMGTTRRFLSMGNFLLTRLSCATGCDPTTQILGEQEVRCAVRAHAGPSTRRLDIAIGQAAIVMAAIRSAPQCRNTP